MTADAMPPTRKDFLTGQGRRHALAACIACRNRMGTFPIVVAHPDDEYACAATTYRLVRKLGWIADQATTEKSG